jgi:hypothetical protein
MQAGVRAWLGIDDLKSMSASFLSKGCAGGEGGEFLVSG